VNRRLVALLVGVVLVAASGAATAHHSFSMFDQSNPIEIEGTVHEFKYLSPHSFIVLEVKDQDGTTALWALEGAAPSQLSRSGWTATTLKPGDQIKLTIKPLRSGAPGGAWDAEKINFKGGQPVAVGH